MKIGIIIPAYNEETFLGPCLDSFINQTVRPDYLVVVNDSSTDLTAEIAREYASRYDWIQVVTKKSAMEHQPGAKVVDAFNFGLSQFEESCDLIGKFDADILLPKNYFELIVKRFSADPRLGICSGHLYIREGDHWVYEAIANKSHVRGPVKLYRKVCLQAMGGIRPGIGWDTADVLLAEFYGFTTETISTLRVKHLRPTGSTYSKTASRFQGQSYYMLRYGWWIAFLAGLKMAYRKRSIVVLWQSLKGYSEARKNKMRPLVTEDEGRFIRRYRWAGIKRNLF